MKQYRVIYFPNSSCGKYFSLDYPKRELLCKNNSSVEIGINDILYEKLFLYSYIESHSIIRVNCNIESVGYNLSPRFNIRHKSLMIYYRSSDYNYISDGNSHIIRNDVEV